MREWKELFFSGKPLYEQACVDPAPAEPTPEQLIELQKEELLNNQDYDEYVVSAEREERHLYSFQCPVWYSVLCTHADMLSYWYLGKK